MPRPRWLSIAAAITLGASMALIPFSGASAAACTTYYISSSTGSDSSSGCTSSTPWQTLGNVNATTFVAGDQILLQAGGSWSATLAPLGSGVAGNPIVVSSYGSGAAPVINGAGAAAAVSLHDQEYWTIQNLEITNTTTTAAPRSGIQLENDTAGILHGIHLISNNIHDVLGYWADGDGQPTRTSGIAFDVTDSNTTSGWDDVLIQGNTLTKVDAGGIYLGSQIGLNHGITTTNAVIQNNTLTEMGGNGIVCVFCASPLVQYNVLTDSGARYSGAGLWTAWSTNGVWQYNEVARNARALVDGQAFDIDNSSSGTILQHNYSHDNPAGFLLICCNSSFGATGNHIIRDNISQNDGASGTFVSLGGLRSGATAQIYNNTVYQGPGTNGNIATGTPAGTATFSNNIIYNLGTGGYPATNTTWTHNLFYGRHPSSEPADAAKLTGNPLFVTPGGGSDGRASASAYKLQTGSPALGAGTLISGNGGLDYFGNTVSSSAAPNIGAYNGAGVAAPATTAGAYWTLDQGTGTGADDVTGHANNGTLQTGATWTAGKVGPYAVALNGTSTGYVDVPTAAVDTSGSYTVSAWVKPATLTGNQTYASIDGANISPFYLQLVTGKLAFTVRGSDSTSAAYKQILSTTAATAGTWYHLTGVHDASAHTISLYVNGVLQGSTSFALPWKATGHTVIGRAKWSGNPVDFATASIDDVQMRATAFTARQVYALGTGAAGYFPLDEGTGKTVANPLGNSGGGWLKGNATWAGSGKIGANAVSLDGVFGSYVATGSSLIDCSTSYAVGTWVKLNTVSGIQTFASMFSYYVSPFYLGVNGGKFVFTTRSSNSTSSTGTTVAGPVPTAGTWYHVLGMYDSSAGTISLYVNGVLQGTASFSSGWETHGAATIGAAVYNRGTVDFTNGQLDDVHFYNRTLTAAEITTLAAS